MTQERSTPPDLLQALQEARRLLTTARVSLPQRGTALSVVEEIDRALIAAAPLPPDGSAPLPSALDREREGRVSAEGAQRRTEFLYQATSALFDSPLDATLRAKRLTVLAVPDLADWCFCDLLEGRVVRRVAVRQWNPDRDALARSLEVSYPLDVEATRGISRVLLSGVSERSGDDLLPLPPPGDPPSPFEALLGVVGARSYLVVPLVASGEVLGALTFVFAESSRRYTETDQRLAEDLARRAALAQQNASLFQQLERAVRSRDEMVAVVSHDLRNPLSSIKMGATLLQQDEADSASPKSKTAIVLRAVGRMEALLRDLLDVASLDSGAIAVEPRPVALDEIVIEALEPIQALVVKKQLVVTTAVEPGLVLQADPGRLLQVLGNLLGNAAKFCETGASVRLTAARDGALCRFSVEDSGPGIAEEHVPHVFNRFWQGRERRREGAGLGLAIAKGIVEAHGGDIGVESEAGVGTTFRFRIPLAPG